MSSTDLLLLKIVAGCEKFRREDRLGHPPPPIRRRGGGGRVSRPMRGRVRLPRKKEFSARHSPPAWVAGHARAEKSPAVDCRLLRDSPADGRSPKFAPTHGVKRRHLAHARGGKNPPLPQKREPLLWTVPGFRRAFLGPVAGGPAGRLAYPFLPNGAILWTLLSPVKINLLL